MVQASNRKVRYAVVGLGYISQVAVLPAFRHALENSELAALVSGDRAKLRDVGSLYGIRSPRSLCTYEEYDDLLRSGAIDAVYIAVPNHLHHDYAVRACQAGVHVLCEKPLAVTAAECEEMIQAATRARVKLMTAYRLHFEEANLCAVELVRNGAIGQPRVFDSSFSLIVDPKNYRAGPNKKGGGPVYDLGIYCLNAARYLFRNEPGEVMAMRFGANRHPEGESEQTMAVSLRFEHGEAANFVCSFASFPTGRYEVLGTAGKLTLEDAYEYVGSKSLEIEGPRGRASSRFRQRDQFAAELVYFSDCVLHDLEIEPSGREGLADIRIIEAIFRSAASGRSVALSPIPRPYPEIMQEIYAPPVRKPPLVRTKRPSRKKAA